MPKAIEVACRNDDCHVDMFSVHYVTFVPDEEYDADYGCPTCGEQQALDVLST